MSNDYAAPDEQVRIVKEYFAKVDAGDGSLLDLFADDAKAYYPKFGTVTGKDEIVNLVIGLTSAVSKFNHDEALMVITQTGNRIAVEGVETGTLTDGTLFPGTARSEGRFCNVFEFEGDKISRMHVYVDPDLAGKHTDLFPSWAD